MSSWLLALLASSQVPYELLALVFFVYYQEQTELCIGTNPSFQL